MPLCAIYMVALALLMVTSLILSALVICNSTASRENSFKTKRTRNAKRKNFTQRFALVIYVQHIHNLVNQLRFKLHSHFPPMSKYKLNKVAISLFLSLMLLCICVYMFMLTKPVTLCTSTKVIPTKTGNNTCFCCWNYMSMLWLSVERKRSKRKS